MSAVCWTFWGLIWDHLASSLFLCVVSINVLSETPAVNVNIHILSAFIQHCRCISFTSHQEPGGVYFVLGSVLSGHV